MNLKLNVLTRLMIISNLPEQGNIEKMMNARNMRNKVSFTSEEMEKLNLNTSEKGITWKPIDDVDLEFTMTEIKFINDIITDLDSKGMVNDSMLDFIFTIKDLLKDEDNSEPISDAVDNA